MKTTLGTEAAIVTNVPSTAELAVVNSLGAAEILFVDPSVTALETILGNLRPGVEAIVLDSARPAARQIAAALDGRHGLRSVHIIAHGAPGRVSFAAGDWSSETLEDSAEDFAAIGRALAPDGDLRLWSCGMGAGAGGAAFVAALECAVDAAVVAASGRIGAAALGGTWELFARSRKNRVLPPLTKSGMASYAGVFSVRLTSAGRDERFHIFGRWPQGTEAGTYFIALNNNGTLEILGKFIVPVNYPGTFAVSVALPDGTYTVGPNVPRPGTIAVYSGKWNPGDQPEATWSLGDFNSEISATLNCAPEGASNNLSL